jgi:hypothetical protein
VATPSPLPAVTTLSIPKGILKDLGDSRRERRRNRD